MAEVLGLAEVAAALGLAEMTAVLGLVEMIDQEKCTKQLVVTVETNVRYHLNQKITDPFIVESVSKITNHKNEEAPGLVEVVVVLGLEVVVVVLGLAERVVVLGLIEVLDLAGMIDQEKCSKQLAVTVETNVRYHLNQKITDPFIAENVFKITDRMKNLS
ncbi:MAG: hypothetical protein AABW60_04760 [Thermoproteota archaeon]